MGSCGKHKRNAKKLEKYKKRLETYKKNNQINIKIENLQGSMVS